MDDEPTDSWIERQERMRKADRPTYILVIVSFFGLLALILGLNKIFLGWGFSEFGWTVWAFIVSLLSLPLIALVGIWWTWDDVDAANEREAHRVWEEEREKRIRKERVRKQTGRDDWYVTNVTLEPGDLKKYGEASPDTQEDDDDGEMTDDEIRLAQWEEWAEQSWSRDDEVKGADRD
jgi:hypothetical protein